jgi:hypothetical protein
MAVKKFSEISPSAGQIGLTDTLIGVQVGTNDVQYTIGNIIPFLPTFSNVDLYVSITGSDSNDGSLANPFATIQHALTIAAQFDYQGLYFPTINVEAGTFNQANIVHLSEIRNSAGAPSATIASNGAIFGANVSTTIIRDSNFNGCFIGSGSDCTWMFNNLTFDTDIWALLALNGSTISGQYGAHLAWSNTVGTGTDNPIFCGAAANATIQLDQTTITFNDTNTGSLTRASAFAFFGQPGGFNVFTVMTIILPSSPMTCTAAFIDLFDIGGNCIYFNNFITNSGSYTGKKVNLGGANSLVFSDDTGTFANIPGVGIGAIDESVLIQNLNVFATQGAFPTFGINTCGGIPNTSSVPSNTWGTFKDLSGGGVYVVENDGGTIKRTALNVTPSPPVTFANLPAAPVQGMMVSITDGLAANCADGTCTTFGTHVTGGTGALKLNLWYNGTNWTLMGI